MRDTIHLPTLLYRYKCVHEARKSSTFYCRIMTTQKKWLEIGKFSSSLFESFSDVLIDWVREGAYCSWELNLSYNVFYRMYVNDGSTFGMKWWPLMNHYFISWLTSLKRYHFWTLPHNKICYCSLYPKHAIVSKNST